MSRPASVHSVPEKAEAKDSVAEPTATKGPWFRSTYTQAVVTGIASFLAPGMYSACAATGAGGLADVKIGNASVAVAFALIVPSALAATGFISKFNVRTSLAIGAAGYAPYAAALYTNSAFGNQWYLILGAVICGLTSGIFWVTEGTIIMVYSEPARKGRLVAIWQSLFNLATLVGGAINLALNVDIAKPGGLRPKTYLVFVGLSSCAPLVSLLLSNPKQVKRADGRPVPALPGEGFFKEVWLTLLELRHPRVLAAAFLWSHSLFVPSFFSTYLAYYFSVRVRGMSSIVQPVLSIIWHQANGYLLDSNIRLRKKLVIAWSVIQAVIAVCVIWVMVDLVHIKNHPESTVVYDWETPRWAVWWVPAVLGSAAAWVSYGYNYYMAAYIIPKNSDGVRMSRIIATLRSAESGSAAVGFGIGSLQLAMYKLGIINIFFLAVVLVLGTWLHIWIWRADEKGTFGYAEDWAEARGEAAREDK